MARSKNNIVTHGMSGMIGDLLVFRQLAGKTIVAVAPKNHGATPATPAQQAVRARFQQAIAYARTAMADAAMKALYAAAAAEGQSAFNRAVSDFFHAPVVDAVDLSGYTGAAGNALHVRATDDFAVAQVTVRIETAGGALVEAGVAVQQPGTTSYAYTTTASNASVAGSRVTVTATDYAGNHTTQHITL